MKRETYYLNTDLELTAPHDLAPLADVLNRLGLISLYVGQVENSLWAATFETEQNFQDPDPNIAGMLTALEALDEQSQSLWTACTIRKFDIGYQCGDEPSWLIQELSTATLSRIAAVGGAVVITLYGAEFPESPSSDA